jgi:hypothetical protein
MPHRMDDERPQKYPGSMNLVTLTTPENDELALDSIEQIMDLRLSFLAEKDRRMLPVGEEIGVVWKRKPATIKLKSIQELFVGSRVPPRFDQGPSGEYIGMFLFIERVVVDYCAISGREETDQEMERVYSQLRRRPDGKDRNPLYSYLRAGVRVLMSMRDTSEAEFQGIIGRLVKSTRSFSMAPISHNYLTTLGKALM